MEFFLFLALWTGGLGYEAGTECGQRDLNFKECAAYVYETSEQTFPSEKKWTGYDPRAGK